MSEFTKQIMENYNISQKELASILGISSAAISQWKSAENISIEVLYKLSRLLQVSVDDLLSQIPLDTSSVEKRREEFGWLRSFKIATAIAMNDNKVFAFFTAYKKLKNCFFDLFYRRITGKLRNKEQDELDYLFSFYTFDATAIKEYTNEEIALASISRIGNKKAMIWELEQVYKCSLKLPWKSCFETGDEKIYLAAYDCLNSIVKDEIVTAFRYINYRWLPRLYKKMNRAELPKYIQHIVFEMINRDGQVRYNVGHDLKHYYGSPQKGKEDKLKLISFPVPHISSTENKKVLRVLDQWNEAEKILLNINGTITATTATGNKTIHYAEYIKTIDTEEMDRIKTTQIAVAEKMSVHKPLAYWNLVKNNKIWVAPSFE